VINRREIYCCGREINFRESGRKKAAAAGKKVKE
jgi:hypothetical protein